MEGGLRNNGMPPEGFANPVTSDGTKFCSNTPVSQLIERVTQAIKANDVKSNPPIAETTDGATVAKNEPTLDQTSTTHEGSRKVGLTRRPNGQS